MGVSGGIQLTELASEHVVLKAGSKPMQTLCIYIYHVCIVTVYCIYIISDLRGELVTGKDSILRFGGSCSMELEWPEESLRGEDKDQIAKVESLAKRVLRRVTQEPSESRFLHHLYF